MLAVIGTLALSATAAQAFGSGPFPLTSFFVCQNISGDDPGKVVTVTESILQTDPQKVRIGNATLACVVAKLKDALTGASIDPTNPVAANSDGLKCYSVIVPKGQSNASAPAFRWHVFDALSVTPTNPSGEDPDVAATSFQYICAPATFNNPH